MIANIECPPTLSKEEAKAAKQLFMEDVENSDRCFSIEGDTLVAYRNGFKVVIQGMWEQGFFFIDTDMGVTVPDDEDTMLELRTYISFVEAFRFKHADLYTSSGERLVTGKGFHAGESIHFRWTPLVNAWDLDDLTNLPARTAEKIKGDLVKILAGKSAMGLIAGDEGEGGDLDQLLRRLHERFAD